MTQTPQETTRFPESSDGGIFILEPKTVSLHLNLGFPTRPWGLRVRPHKECPGSGLGLDLDPLLR